MTAKYLITANGAVNWNATSSWSLTSGGATGAPVPSSTDDVFMDANSGSGTITVNVNSVCLSVNCTGFTGIFSLPSSILSIGGNVSGASNISLLLVANMTFTCSSLIQFTSTSGVQQTVLTAGKTLAAITFNGVGGSWQIQDTLTATGAFTLSAGILDLNSQTISIGNFVSVSGSSRTLTAGSSNITLSATNTTVWNVGASAILNMGTSTITCSITVSGIVFSGFGYTYNNVVINLANNVIQTVLGSNTFNNLTINGSANKINTLAFVSGTTQTTTTLVINGNSAINRVLIQAGTINNPATITATTWTISSTDFRDIIGNSPNLSGISGLSGDCGGNSGITFTSPSTQIASNTTTFTWSTATWTNHVPLPQDFVKINALTPAQTVTIDMPRLGFLVDFSGCTTFTLNKATTPTLYGSLIFPNSVINVNTSNALIFEWLKPSIIKTGGNLLNSIQFTRPFTKLKQSSLLLDSRLLNSVKL